MMQWGQTGAWFLFFLTAVIPGVLLQKDDSPVQPTSDSKLTSETQTYRPVLQPSEAVPPIGTYVLNNLVGKPCIKATLGAEYIVIEKETWYFHLDPYRVRTGGSCGREAAVLSLTLPDSAASLQLTFTEDESDFYVVKLTAHVSPLPVCPGCANKTYSGALAHEKLFTAGRGQSFKCQSKQLLRTSLELRIKLVALQLQAFSLPSGQFGSEVECRPDFNKRVLPIIVGATVVGLFLIALLTFLFIRDRRRAGYDML
ncbi:lysosome-associated membrane glycoprotein 3 [Clinocottus analis]|uniref:lysosome-associated membrane glycoprotein 3 n=1 Tax=Clinocottus analis TaxID=304258 RepID=UPI0035BF2AF0